MRFPQVFLYKHIEISPGKQNFKGIQIFKNIYIINIIFGHTRA